MHAHTAEEHHRVVVAERSHRVQQRPHHGPQVQALCGQDDVILVRAEAAQGRVVLAPHQLGNSGPVRKVMGIGAGVLLLWGDAACLKTPSVALHYCAFCVSFPRFEAQRSRLASK